MQLSAIDRNKTSTFSCENAYVVTGGLAAQTGSDVDIMSADNKVIVPDFQRLTLASATTVVLPHVPVGVTGAEVQYVWKINADGTQGEKLVVSDTVSTGKFTVNAESKTITFAEGEFDSADSEVYVSYEYEASEGIHIANNGEKFSKTVRLLIDVMLRDKCDNNIVYHGKIVYPVAKVDGNFTIEFGEEPSVHSFSAQALVDVCRKDKTLWDLYVVA